MNGWVGGWMHFSIVYLNTINFSVVWCFQILEKPAEVLQRDPLPQPCTPLFTPTCTPRGHGVPVTHQALNDADSLSACQQDALSNAANPPCLTTTFRMKYLPTSPTV